MITDQRTNFMVYKTILILLLLSFSNSIYANQELPIKIDNLIEKQANGQVNPVCDDFIFCRRLYLDVLGRIPSTEEIKKFTEDQNNNKRNDLINQLFTSTEFPRRLEELLNQVLMERRGENPEWQKFLSWAADTNQPWDVIVSSIINSDPNNEQSRGSAYFTTKRLTKVGQQDTDYAGLTRDFGRMFLGIDLQCCQCHDHLFIDDYKQIDFQGLHSVSLNLSIADNTKFPIVKEKPMAQKLDFQSVFEQKPMSVGPKVPFLQEIELQTFPKGEEYSEAPDAKKNNNTGLLKFSPRKILADKLTSIDNRLFAENLANRLWYIMMGRGLVHPLDLKHSDNQPSHPEIYKLLADTVIERKFDIKSILKDLATTKTYQRSTTRQNEEVPADKYRIAIEKPLWAEQLLWSMIVATGPAKLENGPRQIKEAPDLLKKFVSVYGNAAAEPEIDFAPSVKAALFVTNDNIVLNFLEPKDNNLITRLQNLSNNEEKIKEAFLSVLSRYPSEDEQTEILKVLDDQKNNNKILQHLIWALLSSTEFCLNH
jgi:hypothetical protein